MAGSGLFIAFEGIEGSGKSTQAALLARRYETAGQRVVLTREPGGTPLGERIRGLVLDAGGCAILPEAEALLFTAARAQHVRAVIMPALAAGEMVICDRFVDSTLAYQGGGRGLPLEALLAAQVLATGGVMPNPRVLLDLPVDEGLRRRFADPASVNRIDEADVGFHRRVHQAYHNLVAREPDGWLVVDALGSPEVVADRVAAAIAAWNQRPVGERTSTAKPEDGGQP